MKPILMVFVSLLLSGTAFVHAESGPILGKIRPPASKAVHFALRSLANNKFVGLSDDGHLLASGNILSANYFFKIIEMGDDTIALWSEANGKYVTAEDERYSLIVNRDVAKNWETFRLVDAGDNAVALLSENTGKYVCAEGAGSAALIANRSALDKWEKFRLMPVIDMAEVMTAFAVRHSDSVKVRTKNENEGCQQVDDVKVFERWVKGKVGREMVKVQVSGDHVPILDWHLFAEDKTGVHATFPLCQLSNAFPGNPCPFAIWEPMVVESHRYLTPDMGTGPSNIMDTIKGPVTTYEGISTSPDVKCAGNCAPETIGNEVNEIGYLGFDGNIGDRWYVKIASNLNVDIGFTKEHFTWDLGPAPNVYDPEYGWIRYEQTNKGCQSPPGGYTGHMFGSIQKEDVENWSFPPYVEY